MAPHRWDYRLDMLCTVNISMSMSMYMNMDMYVYVHMYYILCLGSNPGFPSCPLSFIRHMIAHFLLILLVGIGSRRRVTMLIVTCSFLGYPVYYCTLEANHACQLIPKSGLLTGDPHGRWLPIEATASPKIETVQ